MKVAKLKTVRKDIARALTVINKIKKNEVIAAYAKIGIFVRKLILRLPYFNLIFFFNIMKISWFTLKQCSSLCVQI